MLGNGLNDEIWMFECAVNWTTPSSSTFSRTQQITVQDFDSDFGNDWTNIAQKGTNQEVDAVPQVLMFRTQYINFGSYQTIMACHTVDVDNTDHAGVRWYELRNDAGTWTVRQQSTYAPYADSRWLGGISMNKNHQIGLGYSISSSTLFPGIRFSAQSSYQNEIASGVLDIPELTIQTGTNSQTNAERWGDYSGMSIDPVNSEYFWFTSQYGGDKETKIACIALDDLDIPANLVATANSSTQITLDWSLNNVNSPVLIAYSTTPTFGTPLFGTTYAVGQTITGGGTVLYIGSLQNFQHTALTSNTKYYYRAWSKNANTSYSNFIETNATTLISDINEVNYEKAVNIYPNPSKGVFTLKFTTDKYLKVAIEIYTTDNKLIYSLGMKNVANETEKSIDLSRHPKGVYLMKITIDGQIFTKNLMIE